MLEANLGVVTGEGISEMVYLSWDLMLGGRQLLREGLLVERDPVKVLHRTRVGMFGE